VWQQHLARVNDLVSQQHGFLVNKIGDSVLTIFQNALHAVAFAMALISDSGHPRVRLRIGIHMGLVNQEMVKGDNVSGQDVSFAQRVMSEATDGGIIVSHPVRQDFEKMGMINDPKKRWIDLVNVLPKGFPEPTRLWRIEAVSE
jgi:class 3 adenylate cyclase